MTVLVTAHGRFGARRRPRLSWDGLVQPGRSARVAGPQQPT
ncbi:hypothetical protein PJP10_28430 [Mycobacterium kansasii]